MYRLKKPNIHASEIAGLVNQELVGRDCIVNKPASLDHIEENTFICLTKGDNFNRDYLEGRSDYLIITDIDFRGQDFSFSYIKSLNPKMDFIKTVNEYFMIWDESKIALSAKIHPNAKLSRNVSVGENVVIGPDVIIGSNTQILNNVVITNQVKIGENCIIKHNSTLGSEGFDFEIDKLGIPVHYPHIGRIIIGDNVWIGSNTSIECGKIKHTVISDDVKIDDLVQIGSNCEIGNRTMITAGVIIERDVRIGNNSLIAPNATIHYEVTIGNNCLVGEGSVVIRSIEDNSVYVGNPARFLKKNN